MTHADCKSSKPRSMPAISAAKKMYAHLMRVRMSQFLMAQTPELSFMYLVSKCSVTGAMYNCNSMPLRA